MNTPKPSYWTDQQTGEPIGPLYSWSDIRELQLEEEMRDMRRKKRVAYVVEPKALTYESVDYQQAIERLPKLPS